MTFDISTLPHESRLHAGTASTDITPNAPVPLSGYGAREGRSTGTNDKLAATALVLSDGAVTVGLLSADLLNVSRELTHDVRRALTADGIDLDEVLLAATHTHAGPYVPARALDATSLLSVNEDVSDAREDIKQGIVSALTHAYERREPARIRIGHDTEDSVQHNRRASGGVGGNVRVPYGPVDPEITALLVETVSGSQAVVYNFACHPVCTTGSETLLSADWPGYAKRQIRAERNDVDVLFLNGAAGDINPVGSSESRSGDEVYEYMERVGRRIGDAALRAVADADSSDATTVEQAPIRIDSVDVRFPLKSPPPVEKLRDRIADLDTQLEALESEGDEVGHDKLAWDRRYARSLLCIAEWDARCLPNRLPYVEIGEIGILGMPGEVLAQHGLNFKANAEVETLVPVGYVNDYVGYVPTLADLENIGYEVRTMKIAPEAIVEFRKAVMELIS